MKYGKLFLILSFAAFLGACAKEEGEREKLDNRVSEAKQLEVKYKFNGSEVQSLAFTHNAVKATLDVEVNNPDLKWSLESSNITWCTVEEGEHKGSGSVVIYLTANDGLEARVPATLTFVAGQYRGASIQVDQSASLFVISQPYFVAGKDGGSWNVNVTTASGVEWSIGNSDWLTGTAGAPATNAGMVTTPVALDVAANTGDSRFGSIKLTSGIETDDIYVYQFGNELSYNSSGDIFFGREAGSFSFVAPGSIIRQFKELPDFASPTIEPQDDGTDLVTIVFEQNISDTNEPRAVSIVMQLNNSSATEVALPAMMQDFTPSHGLNSAKGLKALARVVAEGGSTEPWEKDGVITVLGDIEMAGISDWTGIGTAAHPFSSKFDGGGFSIKSLWASAPLFNVCENAEISNLAMDPLCELSFSTGESVGAIAASAAGTRFTNCSFGGKLTVTAATDGVAIGGIVGRADKTSVLDRCLVNAEIVINTPSLASAFAGGLAGYTEGTVTNCEMTGKLDITTCPATLKAGGITSVLGNDTEVSENTFRGEVALSGTAGTDIRVAGLYGCITDRDRSFDYSTDKSVTGGSISIEGFGSNAATVLYAGGMIGYLQSGRSLSVKGYEGETVILVNHTAVARRGKLICVGGILGGTDFSTPSGTVSFDGVTGKGGVSLKYKTSIAVQCTNMCIGGIAGLVNAPASFVNCKNLGEVGALASGNDYSARSNGYSQVVGGIAGLCFGGNQTYDHCENHAAVRNLHYNNNPILFILKPSDNKYNFYDPSVDGAGGMYTATANGGIVGAFNYFTTLQDYQLTVSSCVSEGQFESYRGVFGGIVGFAGNASIENCSWTGDSIHTKLDSNGSPSNNLASDKGGIAGVLSKSTVKGCTAKGKLESFRFGSAEAADAGGIVAYVAGWTDQDYVVVENCSFYGEIIDGHAELGILGGILGRNDITGTEVKNCKFGGKVNEQPITSENMAEYAEGKQTKAPSATISAKLKSVTVTGTSLWSGN